MCINGLYCRVVKAKTNLVNTEIAAGKNKLNLPKYSTQYKAQNKDYFSSE